MKEKEKNNLKLPKLQKEYFNMARTLTVQNKRLLLQHMNMTAYQSGPVVQITYLYVV